MSKKPLYYDGYIATFMETLTEGKVGHDWCVLFKEACEKCGMGDPQEVLDAIEDIRLGNFKLYEDFFYQEENKK